MRRCTLAKFSAPIHPRFALCILASFHPSAYPYSHQERREGLTYPTAAGNPLKELMKDVIWVAVLKQRGVRPQEALDYVRREVLPGEGLVFVGPTGVEAIVKVRDVSDVPTKTVPPVEGEDRWETSVKAADRVVILWDSGDERQNPGYRQALQEKKPLDILWPNGRRSVYRDGQLQASVPAVLKVAA